MLVIAKVTTIFIPYHSCSPFIFRDALFSILLCMYSSIINSLLGANREAREFRNLRHRYSFYPASLDVVSLSCEPLVKPNEASPFLWICSPTKASLEATLQPHFSCRIIKCSSSLCLFPTTLLNCFSHGWSMQSRLSVHSIESRSCNLEFYFLLWESLIQKILTWHSHWLPFA